MKNLKPITEIKKAPFVWADKGNEMIKRLNLSWLVEVPDGFGDADFTYGDNRIVLDLSQMSIVQFVGCDAAGNQILITTFGTSEPYVPPE